MSSSSTPSPPRPDGRGGDGPCRLRIVGRHRHFINAFGENLIVEHIENAVAEAARLDLRRGGGVHRRPGLSHRVAPGRPGTRAVEVDTELRSERRPRRFADGFDAELKSQCVDYATKRTD
jgi:hypothetical protein